MAPDPSILASLLGGGGGASAGDPLGGAPDAGPDPSSGGQDTVSILNDMIAAAQAYIQVETDEEDKHTMTGVLQTLQSYLAKEQKERDGMMQGKVTLRAMRKAAGASQPL
jgi:hypothetical protein